MDVAQYEHSTEAWQEGYREGERHRKCRGQTFPFSHAQEGCARHQPTEKRRQNCIIFPVNLKGRMSYSSKRGKLIKGRLIVEVLKTCNV